MKHLRPRAAALFLDVHAITLAASLAMMLAGCRGLALESSASFAPGASLSEDDEVAEELRRSLSDLLKALRRGDWTDSRTDENERERYAFFYKSLERGARDAEPIVLKSYPIEDGKHMLTVAFMVGTPDAVAFSRIVELEATPTRDGFHFQCPFERNTACFMKRQVGDITFRFSGAFDEDRALEFARFKSKLENVQGMDPSPLQYDCFQDLDELLKAFGLVHDRSKCNFLQHDLGFLWDNGERFATGTGDERYLFGYASGALARAAADPEAIYWPYVTGVSAYYGGYGLSGDSMDVLASQFREELSLRPTIDFLEEFEKGRGASVHRHFSYYVMCAFLCQEIVTRYGEAAALGLVECGADGELFFSKLEALTGIGKHNFHETIVRLIEAGDKSAMR